MFQKKFCSWLSLCFLIFCVNLHAGKDTPREVLSQAIQTGDLVKVQSLIESFAVGIDELSDDYDSISPLIEAASEAKITIMKYLIEKGACIEGASKKGYSPLVKFIEAGKRVSFQQLIEMVRFMIDHGSDVDGAADDDYTALMAACEHTRCLELIEMLLDEGACIDAKTKYGDTAYLLSLRNNNIKAYRLLVSRGADTNTTWKGLRPLSVLAWEGNIAMAKMLIEETGANINAYDINGATPLMAAAIGGQSAMVQFLLDRGADINARTLNPIDLEILTDRILTNYVRFPKGSTALNFAKTMGKNAMTNFLIDLGGILYDEVEYNEEPSWYRGWKPQKASIFPCN